MTSRVPLDKIVDLASGRLGKEEALALLDQLEHDEHASRDLDLVTSMMDVVEQEGDALAVERSSRPATILSRLRSFADSLTPRLKAHPVLSGVAAFAAVFGALMIVVPSSSPYGPLASMQDFNFGATVRGVDLEDFSSAFDLYQKGKYDDSIRLFERYIRAFAHGPLVEYAHYSAGAAYLRWSEWRLLSLFIGFDKDRVQRGIDHLQEVVNISNRKRLLEDAHWLLAKGRLMQADVPRALEEFQVVEAMGGERREDAAGMIRVLQQMH